MTLPDKLSKSETSETSEVRKLKKALKAELIYDRNFTSVAQAKLAIFEYIEIWYNRKRLHSFLGYKTPIEIETEFNEL